MASDGEIRIKTAIDNSELQKGTKQADGILNKFIGKLSSQKMSNIGASISGIGVAFKAVGAAAQAVKATIDDLTNTYKEQAKAEIQLETAAKNNPYLDKAAVRQLKNYASELQGIGTVGDEKLIPLMAQLAASGRTQAEIQKIMAAALDASASGAISLESAVQGLNQSYSGQIGMLGRQLPMLKNLTAEELKQGKAVEAVAKAYKGMAKETAEATGTAEQLSNAWGDFKEHIGKGLEKAVAPVRKIFRNLLTDINNVISRSKELSGANSNISSGSATAADYDIKIEQAKAALERQEKLLEQRRKEYAETGIDNGIAENRRAIQEQIDLIRVYETAKGKINLAAQEQAKIEKEAADEAERNAAAQKAIADAKQRANDLATSAREAYKKSVDSAEREIEARKSLGEKITKEEKDRIMYEAKYSAYIAMITSAQGALSGNLELEKQKREEIAALAERIAKYDSIGMPEIDKDAASKSIAELRESIEEAYKSMPLDMQADLQQKYTDTLREIDKAYTESLKAETEERKRIMMDAVNMAADFAAKTSDIMQQASNLMLETVRNNSRAELATLEKQYLQGEIGEEEYEKKKVEAKKKAAKEEYKIQMFQWSASILQATANIAQGVAAALSQTPPASFISAGLVGAAGAVQIASIIASKPTPPSFAGGGIVQGNSYTGDKVRANVNSGEMILNAAQQKSLWEAANGRGAGGGMQVVINNSAANIASARPVLTKDQIEIIIDARVNDSLKSGRYDQSLTMANQGMSGDYYGI